MIIRPEKESDINTIFKITKKAFADHPFSKNTEQLIINALREDNALIISLVAEVDGQVVGHVAFSSIGTSDGNCDWYALGPISVMPDFQRQGIGKALIEKGLSELKSLPAKGCVLVGEPVFYNRFGFKHFPDLRAEGVPPQYVLALPFNGKTATGTIIHHRAFTVKN